MRPTGTTRSVVRRDHAVISPDSHVRSPLPGWTNAVAIVLISPRLGAAFSQYIVEMERGGSAGPPAPGVQRFVWVMEGRAALGVNGSKRELSPGDHAFLPAGTDHAITARRSTRLMIVEKPYVPAPGALPPEAVGGEDRSDEAVPLLGDPDVTVQVLLPEGPSHDMAMNLMSFAPGASLPFVEVHSMEHGLLMLEGTMVYRLGDAWYQVGAGDVVYMAPYCPQWAAAYGKGRARYLLYKDWNRDPLVQP